MFGMTFGEWFGGVLCLGFPAWVVVIMMVLIQNVKKPKDAQNPERQRGFPIAPKPSNDLIENPSMKGTDDKEN